MLILTRQENQSIIIDGNIAIMVIEIRGDKVKLGIEAPQNVPVNRNEVQERIDGERKCK